MPKTTMPEMWHDLVNAPTIHAFRCVVCGRPLPNGGDQHHIIPRSAGQYVDARGRVFTGRKRKPKGAKDTPTVTLCGSGNASGCHGLAHSGRLHFRWVRMDHIVANNAFNGSPFTAMGGRLECLVTDEPIDRLEALATEEGWRRLR